MGVDERGSGIGGFKRDLELRHCRTAVDWRGLFELCACFASYRDATAWFHDND